MTDFCFRPVSVVTRSGLQRVELSAATPRTAHYLLNVYREEKLYTSREFALSGGKYTAVLYLPAPEQDFTAAIQISALDGKILHETQILWKAPRQWTLYVMISSHTDIGLHNSQYIQRRNSVRFLEDAMRLCDETEEREPENRYRYVMEGTWFWSNYVAERGKAAADRVVRDYIRTGKIGLCAGVAGNHTQNFGLEETCRCTYNRKWLKEQFGQDVKTFSMIDNNGLNWGIVQPFADAGYENVIFAPNQWNPLPSEVFHKKAEIPAATWNPDTLGGGARVDVSYDSALPMLFWWEDSRKRRLLVWASTAYGHGGDRFGLPTGGAGISEMEEKLSKMLPLLEEKYPYDLWLLESYGDDQQPALKLTDSMASWNERFAFPKIRTLGNPDEPFRLVKERFSEQIPTLYGDITGGWYQHPVAAPDYLADKLNIDRCLANAEKWATLASVFCGTPYPADRFARAWAALLMHDEHSYGTSGYQGRRVYETWMQHRDWLDKAAATAKEATQTALDKLARQIRVSAPSVLVFNPTALVRREKITAFGGEGFCTIPAFGWKAFPKTQFQPETAVITETDLPPVIENDFYRMIFDSSGAVAEIYDKALCRVLNSAPCNQLFYTADNHRTFHTPQNAHFRMTRKALETVVVISAEEPCSGAALSLTVTLPSYEKRIDFDNRLLHVYGLSNNCRYNRYLYFGFPVSVENCRRFCDLGGVEAEYGVDLTAHGTDVYMAAHEWCCAENDEFGVGLCQQDSQLIEFDHIHPDKTDFGNPGSGSAMYSYLANDWLQMHSPGGSHMNFQFRYTMTSYIGNHRTARLAALAERLCNPIQTMEVVGNTERAENAENAENTDLPIEQSLLNTEARLIALKRADDGNGLIMRLHADSLPHFETILGNPSPAHMDESPAEHLTDGFSTLRIGISRTIPVLQENEPDELAIGGVETGLITVPRAVRGEQDGMLYLLWGHCRAKAAFYEVYRGEERDFIPNRETLLARVVPEEGEGFTVGRYVDCGLERHREYWYRVRAVSVEGKLGAFSEVFCGVTKESPRM